MSTSNEVVVRVLTENVKRLERHIAELHRELEKEKAASLEAMLGPLRLRQAVLVYFGKETLDHFSEKLAEDFGSDIANQALRHMFDINRAPIDTSQQEAFRTSFAGGLSLW